MTFTPEQVAHLSAKLDPKHVKSRAQAGRKLSYVEGWHVIAEANRIFGFDGWSRETVSVACVWTGEVNDKPACTYTAKVRVTVGTVTREGTGAGHGVAKNMGDAHESAIKEAETDAMKRALMTFGWPFGLALYDKDQEHVECEAKAAQKPAPTLNGADKLKLLAEAIRNAIDRAGTIVEVNEILDVEKDTIAEIAKGSKTAADFLTDRAKKKIALLGNAPGVAA